MLCKNKKLQLAFQLLIVVVSFIGLYLNFKLFKSIKGIYYFTILSNLYVFLFYFIHQFYKLFNRLIKDDRYYMFKGLALISILCTMLIYNFVIAPSGSAGVYVGHQFECNIVHIIVPLLTLFECIIFEDKGVLKYKYIIKWASSLAVYTGVVLIYSKLGGTFLNNNKAIYPFLDFANNGYLKCIFMCIGIVIAYSIIGAIIVFIDNKMKVGK